MKNLLNNLNKNDDGERFEKILNEKTKYIIDEFISKGYDPNHLKLICYDVINSSIKESYENIIKEIKKYYNNDLNILKIRNPNNNDIKSANFSGYDKDGNKLWIFEPEYEPFIPCGIKDIYGKYYWFILFDYLI